VEELGACVRILHDVLKAPFAPKIIYLTMKKFLHTRPPITKEIRFFHTLLCDQ
jgi:hypothetical protein